MPFVKGYKPSKETRLKMSQAKKGIKLDEKHRLEIGKGLATAYSEKRRPSDNPGWKNLSAVEKKKIFLQRSIDYAKKNSSWKNKVNKSYFDRIKSAPGKLTKKIKEAVMLKYDRRCARCKTKKKLCIDHIVPLSNGGTNYKNNLQVLCRSCNAEKGAKLPTLAFAS